MEGGITGGLEWGQGGFEEVCEVKKNKISANQT